MIICQYCNNKAELVTGMVIYPHRKDLHDKKFYLCVNCNAYCGCHPGTIRPLGTLANDELRALRKRCHSKLDPIWRAHIMKRKEVYAWLSKQMNIDIKDTHIAMFDKYDCEKALEYLSELTYQLETITLEYLSELTYQLGTIK